MIDDIDRYLTTADVWTVLDLIAEEFESDPTSTACFDERLVDRAIALTRHRRALLHDPEAQARAIVEQRRLEALFVDPLVPQAWRDIAGAMAGYANGMQTALLTGFLMAMVIEAPRAIRVMASGILALAGDPKGPAMYRAFCEACGLKMRPPVARAPKGTM